MHLMWPLQYLLGCENSVLLKFINFYVQTPLPFSSPAQCHTVFGFRLRLMYHDRPLDTADYNGSCSISFPPDVVGLHSVFPNLHILEVREPWLHTPNPFDNAFGQPNTGHRRWYFDASWINREVFPHLVGITSRCRCYGIVHFENCASKLNIVTQ